LPCVETHSLGYFVHGGDALHSKGFGSDESVVGAVGVDEGVVGGDVVSVCSRALASICFGLSIQANEPSLSNPLGFMLGVFVTNLSNFATRCVLREPVVTGLPDFEIDDVAVCDHPLNIIIK
jgi:hypothetical protein